MKKILMIVSAVALTGTAFVIAQEGDREAPRGDRRGGGGGMFANAPFFKALGMAEDGSVKLPKTDEEKTAFLAAIAKCDTDKDGKLSRTEIFGERRRGGGGAGGDRRRPGGGDAGGQGGNRPRRPASE